MQKQDEKETKEQKKEYPSLLDFGNKKDWAQKLIEKIQKAFEKEENKKLIQVFIVDPVIQYVLGKIFPYIMIICVLFVVLTVMTSATLVLVFTRAPSIFGR